MKRIVNIIAAITLIFTGFFVNEIKEYFPTNYLVMFSIIIIVIMTIVIFINLKIKAKILYMILLIIPSILIVGIETYAFSKLETVTEFVETITKVEGEKDIYDILTLKEFEINIEDSESIGVYMSEKSTFSEAYEKLKEKYDVELIEYTDYNELFDDLFSGKIKFVFANEGEWNIIIYNLHNMIDEILVVDSFEFNLEIDNTSREFDITKDTFLVYLSGIDSTKDAMTNTRSDVNMIFAINPTTKEILSINIPRDYFVQFSEHGGYDKLTHAGIYGISSSMQTIENFMDIEFDYYVRVNFDAVVDLVDAIGGVEVYSEYNFNSWRYSFKKGYNEVNGKEALEFSRYRYMTGGDRQRGKNQQALIDAIVDKVGSSKVLLNSHEEILESLKGSLYTSISSEEIISLISMQLGDLSAWKFDEFSLDGSDSMQSTFLTSELRYVMIPNEKTIKEAQEKINDFMN